jgi:hypothetical protein
MHATQTQTQTEVVTIPDPPTPPPAPVTIRIVGADGKAQMLAVPATREQVRELVRQREELGDQLSSVSDRRRQLSEEIRSAPEGVSKTGLEGRLAILDQRIMTLENDLAVTGQQLAAASSELVTSTRPQPSGDEFVEGLLTGGFFTLLTFPLLYFYLRRRWRKRGGQAPALDMPTESARRLERLENGMESIAIEIERVSEGQRFVTRLLSEGQSPVTARRIAEPVPASAPPEN